jgi:hypothetical protein
MQLPTHLSNFIRLSSVHISSVFFDVDADDIKPEIADDTLEHRVIVTIIILIMTISMFLFISIPPPSVF